MPEALAWLLAADAAAWLVVFAHNLFTLRRTPRLGPPASPLEPAADPPLVSILVPARNEADRILEASVRSLLGQRHPRIEVLSVDDRSTDETGAILGRIAAEDERLTVIDGLEPPPDWVGKVHALHQALAAAEGDWILATDADCLLHPEALGSALAAARERAADVVTLVVGVSRESFAVNLVLPVAGWMIFTVYPPLATNNPRDRRALGCGGFLMTSREALAEVGGYASVAGDVADDVALARRLKDHGRRIFCAFAPELVWTPMYRTLGELWNGFSKNAIRGVNSRVPLALLALLLNLAVAVAPAILGPVLVAGLALGLDPAWAPAAGAALLAALALCLSQLPVYREFGVNPAFCLAAPWAFAVMCAIMVNATVREIAGRPVSWRGRRVPPSGGRNSAALDQTRGGR